MDTKRVRNKNRRKKKKIKIDSTTVAEKIKIEKKEFVNIQKNLYKKYEGQNYIGNSEKNLHEIFKIILTK